MAVSLERYLSRLRLICIATLSTVVIYGGVVFVTPPPEHLPLAQGEHFLWIFAALSVLNLVTIMPVYRAMLATSRGTFARSADPGPLLASHLKAHAVAFARLDAVALLGLVLFFLTGRGDWFWVFNGVAAVGMVLLWPLREKIENLVASPTEPRAVPAP